MQRWWTHRMRASATPATVRALMDMNSLVDVRALLPSLNVPTLIVQRRGDQLVPLGGSRWMATQIPGAELVEFDGSDHFVSGDPDQILDAFEPFITSTPRPEHRLALAAVVNVTGRGDAEVGRALVESGGRARRAAHGDAVVLFDGPATGVRAAWRALQATPSARAGLAIAEVAVDGGPVSGPGVDEALRLGSAAQPGDLLVSPTAGVLLSSVEVDLAAYDEEAWRVQGIST
jgi:hypothetical protein